MTTTWRRAILSAALLLGLTGAVQPVQAGAFAWISAPTWTYSAAAASSTAGTAYFWGLSVGVGTYSWAYAFSNSAFGGAFSFAEAATGLGGMGGTQVGGIADPFAGFSADISLLDPSNPSGYPTTDPASDPFSASYTVSDTGITFTGSGSELSGVDEVQAFLYTGDTDSGTLEGDLGVSSESGTTQDDSTIADLISSFGLVALDDPDTDPGSLTSLTFTENDSDVNPADVILVAEGAASSTPEPSTSWALAAGLLGVGLLARRRRRATA